MPSPNCAGPAARLQEGGDDRLPTNRLPHSVRSIARPKILRVLRRRCMGRNPVPRFNLIRLEAVSTIWRAPKRASFKKGESLAGKSTVFLGFEGTYLRGFVA